MSKLPVLCLLLLLAAMVCSCEKTSPDAVELVVDFSWKDTKHGSPVSPELRIQGLPEKTARLEVSMWDLTNRYHHGGGTVEYTGEGVIPAGALKEYTGPSPPSGSPRYEFTVKALDADGVVIGSGKMMRRFPPEGS